MNDSLTATELDYALKNHIFVILNHYKSADFFAFDIIVSLRPVRDIDLT